MKELFDKYNEEFGGKFSKKNITAVDVENENNDYSTWNVDISYTKNGKKEIIGRGSHPKKKAAEQFAAKESIKKLNELGYIKEVDPIYDEINK